MKYAIGIDIGGTITKIGLVSEQGKCLEKTSFRTKEFESFSNYIIQLDKSINNLTKNKTTLVIAHRLSTIKKADSIVVMKDGNIVGAGKHDDLMMKSKDYESLYSKQVI